MGKSKSEGKKVSVLGSQKEFFNERDNVERYEKYKEGDENLRIINSLKKNTSVLSLGCGGGREIKELAKRGHKVTAIDFAEKMIEQSKKIEPKATYYCVDATDFAEKNKNNKKFDYILGLYSFLNYIDKSRRRVFVKNLSSMLKKDGKIIFEIRRLDERMKDLIKSCIAPFYAIRFGESWEFGDIYSVNPYNRKEFLKSHHFSDKQLRKIFRGCKIIIYKNTVVVKN